MCEKVVSLFTAVFVLGVGMVSVQPGDAYAANKIKKTTVACYMITDAKKKQKCMKADTKKTAACEKEEMPKKLIKKKAERPRVN